MGDNKVVCVWSFVFVWGLVVIKGGGLCGCFDWGLVSKWELWIFV